MFKKAKLFSLLAIIVASTVVGLFGFTGTSYAQTNGSGSIYIDPGIEKDVVTKAWRAAMLSCLRHDLEDGYRTVSYENLRSGNWFHSDGQNKNVGYLVESEDGRYTCHEEGFVTGFKSYFGWGNEFIAACHLGFVPANNRSASLQECLDSTDEAGNYTYHHDDRSDDRQITLAASAIDGQVNYKTNSDVHDARQLYVLYMQTFRIACATGNPTTTEPAPGSEDYLVVKAVDGYGQDVDVYYTVESESDSKYTRRTEVGSGGSNEEKTCAEIASAINDNASAYASWVEGLELSEEEIALGTGGPAGGGDGGESASSCRIDAIGWLVCPVVNLMARLVDGSYEVLDKNLLRTEPVDISDNDNPLYRSWKTMRDLANIAFVLAFLIIVFSQLTSFGVTNYGIKRLLPKLIIAAIMVNLSYFICAIAVDISNILGSSLKNLLDSAANGIDTTPSSPSFAGGGGSHAPGWIGIAAGALVATGLAGGPLAVLALLIPLLFAALISVITVVLVLVLRQVLIILLIVISPLAFVALLLPNTESYFKYWSKTFQTMLLLYPIVALIFGASALASTVIMASSDDILVQLMGAAAAVIPLAVTPIVLKFAGGVLNRFAGFVNNPNKGPIDGLRNKAMAGIEDQQTKHEIAANKGKNVWGGRAIRRRNVTESKRAKLKERLGSQKQRSIAEMAEDKGFARELAGGRSADEGDVEKVRASAISTNLSESAKEIQAIQTTMIHDEGAENLDRIGARMATAAQEGDEMTALAAQNILLKKGNSGINQYRQSMQQIEQQPGIMQGELMAEMRRNVLEDHPGIKADAKDIMDHAGQRERDTNSNLVPLKTLSSVSNETETWNMPDSQLVTQKTGSLREALRSGAIDQAKAERIASNTELAKHLDPAIRNEFNNIASGGTYNPNAPAPPTRAPAPNPTTRNPTTQQGQTTNPPVGNPAPQQPTAAPTPQQQPPTQAPQAPAQPTPANPVQPAPQQQATAAAPQNQNTGAGTPPAGWSTTPSGFTYPPQRAQRSSGVNPSPTPPQQSNTPSSSTPGIRPDDV